MELKVTRLQTRDRIATITLARPHRMNAWTGRMNTEYRWCLAQAEDDPRARVIVVTGEGRAFCAGADTSALEGHVSRGAYNPGTAADLATPGYGVQPEFDADFAYHFGLSKPVIAAVNGAAAGLGLVLACFCDIRFAARGAKLTTAHGKLGLPAEIGLSWLLPRLIGLTRANDLLLSSRVLLAEEAAGIGLVNAVVEPEDLMQYTYEYASILADRISPISLRWTKRQIYTDLHREVAAAVKDAERLVDELVRAPDFREGVAALVAKRPPNFPDPHPAGSPRP